MRRALFTTEKDFSVIFFEKYNWDIFIYDVERVINNDYDIVYFRDPFNEDSRVYNQEELNTLIQKFKNSYSIDNIRFFDDLSSVEDKWVQAQKYKKYMPKTYLPSEKEFIAGKMIAKKRISQRAKDIKFEIDGSVDDSWIIQDLLDVKEELRVYCVFGNVIPEATIKTNKCTGKVKVIGARLLTPEELDFCKQVAKKSGLDFIGIDIARTTDDEIKLIEVNRSPQFKRFVEFYGEKPLSGILSANV